jgi:TolA-binding protein
MAAEEKHKINVWCPGCLWKKIEALGYDSPTKAVIIAFEKLIEHQELGSNQEALGSNQEARVPEMEKRLEEAQNQIEDLKKDKEDLIEMYNKHVIQVQTLINQKAIEAPGAKKPWWRFW